MSSEWESSIHAPLSEAIITDMGNWAAKEPPSLAPLPTDRQAGALQPKCPCLAPDAAQIVHLSTTALKQSDLMRQINVVVRALSLLGLQGAGGSENGAVGRRLGDQAAG